jgi:hypothetical protein
VSGKRAADGKISKRMIIASATLAKRRKVFESEK